MLSLILGIALSGFAQQAGPATVYYRLKPIPSADRTILDVSVSFKANGPVSIRLPGDAFGTPNLHRFVTSFEAGAGTVVRPGSGAQERIVHPDGGGDIRLRYVLSYDPKALADYTFAPNVGPRHFHAAGGQWMLQIGDFLQEHKYMIELVDPPRGWRLYSSTAPDSRRFEAEGSYRDLRAATAIGGGANYHQTFTVKSKPVSLFIQGKFSIPNREIAAAAKRIVSFQRGWFEDYDHPFYQVVVLPKGDNVAGFRIKNLFVCFIKQDVTREQLYLILAHEMLHNWLTAEIIKPAEGESPLRHAWFYEGVNDYLARRLLADAGLLSEEKFAALINRDVINIADNPHRAATYVDMVAAAQAGRYGIAFNKLSYYRGGLIAHNWEAQLRKRGDSRRAADLIRDLYRLASRSGGAVAEDDFFELAATYGLDARGDFERHILRGQPINLAPGALGGRYELCESAAPSFDPGFSIERTLRGGVVTGVVVNGAAFRTGLREGMRLVRMENYNRFGNAWSADRPMIVVVKMNEREQSLEFFPHGTPMSLLLYKPRSGAT